MRNIVSPRFIAISGLAIIGLAAASLAAASLPARAETKIFIVENQPDGYGIDQCLATGATCGRPMASAYCQSREFDDAVSFRKADREEISKETGDSACPTTGCVVNFVAIECQR